MPSSTGSANFFDEPFHCGVSQPDLGTLRKLTPKFLSVSMDVPQSYDSLWVFLSGSFDEKIKVLVGWQTEVGLPNEGLAARREHVSCVLLEVCGADVFPAESAFCRPNVEGSAQLLDC